MNTLASCHRYLLLTVTRVLLDSQIEIKDKANTANWSHPGIPLLLARWHWFEHELMPSLPCNKGKDKDMEFLASMAWMSALILTPALIYCYVLKNSDRDKGDQLDPRNNPDDDEDDEDKLSNLVKPTNIVNRGAW